MNFKWSFYFGAVVMAAYLLISRGVPIVPVLAGCGLAALMTWRKIKMSRLSAQRR
jgi:hypothetical protein